MIRNQYLRWESEQLRNSINDALKESELPPGKIDPLIGIHPTPDRIDRSNGVTDAIARQLTTHAYKNAGQIPSSTLADSTETIQKDNHSQSPSETQPDFDITARSAPFKGGDPNKVPSNVADPNYRTAAFDIKSTGGIDEAQLKQHWNPTSPDQQVWVVLHGWNCNYSQFQDLADKLKAAKPNDIVLLLNWTEASGDFEHTVGSVADGGNFYAASWITAVANFAYNKLTEWGVTGEKLNFMGHSLGTLVSSEIADRFGEVNRIVALEPPSEINKTLTLVPHPYHEGYDLDYSNGVGEYQPEDRPVAYNQVSQFSTAFIGSNSIAGNQEFAARTDESFELNFNKLVESGVDAGEEHGWVVSTFKKLIDPAFNSKLAVDPERSEDGNIFYLGNDTQLQQPHSRFLENAYDGRHEGVISVPQPNGQPDDYMPNFLVVKNRDLRPEDDIVYGTTLDDQLLETDLPSESVIQNPGNDIFYGDKGNDKIIADKGSDSLYGGLGNDLLEGGADSDILFADEGNDLLNGAANDILVGFANSTALSEVDTLIGGLGSDTFVVGKGDRVYYVGGGDNDYALISDFSTGDRIQLEGSLNGYTLETSPSGLPQGTAIYRDLSPDVVLGVGAVSDLTSDSSNQVQGITTPLNNTAIASKELIGIVAGVSDLSLDKDYFTFV